MVIWCHQMVQHSMGELLDQVGTHCVERANTLGLLWSQMVDEFERMLAVQDSIVAKHVAALQDAKLVRMVSFSVHPSVKLATA